MFEKIIKAIVELSGGYAKEVHEHEFDTFVKTMDVRPIDEKRVKGVYRELWKCRCGKEEIRTTVGYI